MNGRGQGWINLRCDPEEIYQYQNDGSVAAHCNVVGVFKMRSSSLNLVYFHQNKQLLTHRRGTFHYYIHPFKT